MPEDPADEAAEAAEPAEDGRAAAAGRGAFWRRVRELAQQAADLADRGARSPAAEVLGRMGGLPAAADEGAAQQLESLRRLMGMQGAQLPSGNVTWIMVSCLPNVKFV